MREWLLTAVLSWYADPSTWEARSKTTPYSSGTSCKATVDAGRVARLATSSDSVGTVLTALCDAHGVALTALARKSGISDSRIGEIARGSDPNTGEWHGIVAALSESVKC